MSQPPTISTIAPRHGMRNENIVITGTNFSTIPADNVVWFGGVKGTVTAATATTVTVAVPNGAGNPVRVYTNGLMAEAPSFFIYTYGGTAPLSGSAFNSFTPGQGFAIQNGSYNGLALHSSANLKYADLDEDGKPDMLLGRIGVYIQHNTSVPGPLSAGTPNYLAGTVDGASFEARLNGGVQGLLSELTTYNANHAQEGDIDYADLDGDGKMDVVSCVYRPANTDRVVVFRNVTAVPGTLNQDNFTVAGTYNTSGRWARRLRAADLDNDGRVDIVISTSGGGGAVLRNTSSPGNISFDPIANLSLTIGEGFIELADFDQDGKTDLATRSHGGTALRIYQNTTSAPGTISFAAEQVFTIPSGGFGFKHDDLYTHAKIYILVTGSGGTLTVLRNTSTPGSISMATNHTITTSTSNISSASIGDLDGDAIPDIVFVDEGYTAYAVRNTSVAGSLSFDPYFALNPSGGMTQYVQEVVIQDIDGDGRNDVATASPYANGVHYFTNVSSYSTLPVTWLYFTGKETSRGNSLHWGTASERNNSHFVLQRKNQADSAFHDIGQVNGSHNSSLEQTYTWLDQPPPGGLNWYRIKQVDANGRFNYSKTISIENRSSNEIKLWPNPVGLSPDITLQINSGRNGAANGNKYQHELRVFDAHGKVVISKQFTGHQIKIAMNGLPPGSYQASLYTDGKLTKTTTFIK